MKLVVQATMAAVALRLLLLLPIVLMFRQNTYTLIFERLEVVVFNSSYLGSLKTHNFKYNRTYTAVNITGDFKRALGRKLKVQVQAYKFASNEYRLFPLRFMFDFCSAAEHDEFGFHRFFECGNVTGCPIRGGKFRMCNWAPDGQRFPPHIPKGSYMVDLIFIHESVEVGNLQGYVTIKYPEV